MNTGAHIWFTLGASVFILAGGMHALLALIDTFRPTWFAPIDASARSTMEGTGVRLRDRFPGDGRRPSLWRAWLGFNVSQGLGAFAFGLFCVLVSSYDFELVERIGALRPFTIAVAAAYFAIALCYWFYAVAILTGTATACFTIAALLMA